MGYKVVREPNIMPLDIMVKPFRPNPKTIGKISAAHFSVVHQTPKSAVRQASPCLVGGTGFQVGDQFLDLLGMHPSRTYQGARIGQSFFPAIRVIPEADWPRRIHGRTDLLPHSVSSTTTDLAGRAAVKFPSDTLEPLNSAGLTASDCSKVLCAVISEAVSTRPDNFCAFNP